MTTQNEIEYKVMRFQMLWALAVITLIMLMITIIILATNTYRVHFEMDNNTLEAVKEMNMTSLYKSQENQRFRIAERGEFNYTIQNYTLNHSEPIMNIPNFTLNKAMFREGGYYIVFNIPAYWVENSTLTIQDCENLSMQIVHAAGFVNKMCEGLK